MLPIPKKLLKQGLRDMLRISDARMSGTSYGACVLHVAPEALRRRAAGAAADRRHRRARRAEPARSTWWSPTSELARRRAAWTPPRAALRARLRLDVHAAHRAGRRGLRLRLPAHRVRRAASASRTSTEASDHGARTCSRTSTRAKLMRVSTATLVHRAVQARPAQPVHPGRAPAARPNGRNMVGQAFTLRYIPAREDLNTLDGLPRPDASAARGGRGMPAGRGAGDRQPQGRARRLGRRHPGRRRLMMRGVAGVVTDGGFRDSPEIAALGIPAYHNRPSRADQPDAAPGARHQRADRLRRRRRSGPAT